MALDFPQNPSAGDLFPPVSPRWQWDGAKWSALATGVIAFNGRTGGVTLVGDDITVAGGALLDSPLFVGNPRGPTAAVGTNTQQLATTAFVHSAILSANIGVSSWEGRTGAVSLTANDISARGGALLASPLFTGVPQSVTPSAGSPGAMIATKSYVDGNAGVTAFNTRTGAVTLQLADVMGAGGAPVGSPALTGTPTAPTAPGGTNNTQIATTGFVHSVMAGGPGGGPSSINSWAFTTPGPASFVTPADSTTNTVYRIRMVAGGGGSGGSLVGSQQYAGAGGGGEGVEGFLSNVPPSTPIALVVGAGGSGGPYSQAGSAGGVTSFSTGGMTITANAGGGGDVARATPANYVASGVGGSGGNNTSQGNWTRTVAIRGGDPLSSFQYGGANVAPNGGDSMLGFGSCLSNQSSVATGPPGYGGGAGAPYNSGVAGVNGGNGGGGAILIERMQAGTAAASIDGAALSLSINARMFTEDVTYVPTPGTVLVMVEAVGGSGGGGATVYGPNWGTMGGGGGSGGYSRSILTAQHIGASQQITIGQGGAGAVGAQWPANASNGTATSFGSLVIANGGGGGVSNDITNNWGQGGLGATPGSGQLALSGNPGFVGGGCVASSGGPRAFVNAGHGGSMFSGGARAPVAGFPVGFFAGVNGTLGGGGSGGVHNGTNTPANGGNGGNGWCMVTELVLG